MSVLKDSNKDILQYFSKFKDNDNYEEHFKKLDQLSIFRLKGEIELGDIKMPYIGTSDDLSQFPEDLKNWEEKDVFEVKNIIKLHDCGEIENIEEAIIFIQILRSEDNHHPILDKIYGDLERQSLDNLDNYQELLEIDNIICSNLWKFLMTIID